MLGKYRKAERIATRLWKKEWADGRKDAANVYIDSVEFNLNEDFIVIDYRVEDINGSRHKNIIVPTWIKTPRDLAIYLITVIDVED